MIRQKSPKYIGAIKMQEKKDFLLVYMSCMWRTHIDICLYNYTCLRGKTTTHNIYVVFLYMCPNLLGPPKNSYNTQPFLLVASDDAGCLSSALGQWSTSFFQGMGHDLGRWVDFFPTEIVGMQPIHLGVAKTLGTKWVNFPSFLWRDTY